MGWGTECAIAGNVMETTSNPAHGHGRRHASAVGGGNSYATYE